MNSTKAKLSYLLRSARYYAVGRRLLCPECNQSGTVVERKAIVTQLRRCQNCHLLFRTPTISESEMSLFYSTDYAQSSITELPDAKRLDELKLSNFCGTSLDYSPYIETVRRLGYADGATIYDYGCSWGYGVWQFCNAGFNCTGWEIDARRLNFGETNLGVIKNSFDELKDGSLDVFFSSHVIEHVPYPKRLIEQALPKLKPQGMLFCATPNGSNAFRTRAPEIFHRLWGLSHPQLIDEQFLTPLTGGEHSLAVTSNLSELTTEFTSRGRIVVGDLSNVDLFFVFKRR